MSLLSANCDEFYKTSKELKKDEIQALMDWLKLQPHLPKLTELQVILFLHSCYYSSEATKKCIDAFFTAVTHTPEFFKNMNPMSKEIQLVQKTTIVTVLPKLTPEGYSILYTRLIDTNADNFVFNEQVKYFAMVALLYLIERPTSAGNIVILDSAGTTMKHIMRVNLMSIKKAIYFLTEALPTRLKGFHFVNAVPALDTLMSMAKPFLTKELLNLIHIHKSKSDTVFKFLPKDCLPKEIDGTLGPAIEAHKKSKESVNSNAAFFAEHEKLLVDESKRPGKPKSAGDLFGIEGTFKKLDID